MFPIDHVVKVPQILIKFISSFDRLLTDINK